MNYFKLPLIYALLLQNASAQVTIQPSTKVNIEGGTFLATTGNIVSAVDINGVGTLLMKGSVLQQLNMNGLTIPNLRIENPNNIMLSSSVQVNTLLTFISGKLLTGNNLLTLRTGATISGAAAGKFVETNGTGQLRKILAANVTNFLLPLGNGSNYTPITVSSSGTYSSASVSVN